VLSAFFQQQTCRDGRTSKDGQDGLMDGLDLARMQYVAREEGDYEQDDENGQGP